METNYYIYFLVALLPLIVGFIWYHKAVFGNAWIASSGVRGEEMDNKRMIWVFGLSYLFSLFLAFGMSGLVVHQSNVQQVLFSEPGFQEQTGEAYVMYTEFMETYGNKHRTFGHGALHGFFFGLTIALPLLGIIALFERKSVKYVAINVGYWTVSAMLMGGLISQFV